MQDSNSSTRSDSYTDGAGEVHIRLASILNAPNCGTPSAAHGTRKAAATRNFSGNIVPILRIIERLW